jgi:hypothetical protein
MRARYFLAGVLTGLLLLVACQHIKAKAAA